MVKKPPERRKIFLSFFIIYFTFSLSPYGKKQNHLLFPPFLSSEIEKPQGKTYHKNFFFFFFFLLFCILPLFVIGKITTYLFFSKFRLKLPYNADKRAEVSFFTNYLFFRRDYADLYTYPHTLRFSDTLRLKNALNTCFLKLPFFALYSFYLPPKHFLIIFSGKLTTKNS